MESDSTDVEVDEETILEMVSFVLPVMEDQYYILSQAAVDKFRLELHQNECV